MADKIVTFKKAPYERLDYTVDWSKEVTPEADTVASATWTLQSDTVDGAGPTSLHLADGAVAPTYGEVPSPTWAQSGSYVTTTTSVAYISGGTLGKIYLVQADMITAAGRKYARQFNIQIIARVA